MAPTAGGNFLAGYLTKVAAKVVTVGLLLSAGVSTITHAQAEAAAKAIGQAYQDVDASAKGQMAAAQAVIDRVAPAMKGKYQVEIIPAAGDLDVFELDNNNGVLVIRGNKGLSITAGFNRYLQDYCNSDVSWLGSNVNIPATLKLPTEKVRQVTAAKHRAMYNYCTFSYTMPWWNWDRWQQELDLQALKGINMPLSITGIETAWYNVLLKYDFTDAEARAFISGPSHLAWQWMQNIEGLGGPISKPWLETHVELGQKIIKFQRSLGMEPIMQGFSGHVPKALKQKRPDANIHDKPEWGGRKSFTSELDPLDPLFVEMGTDFMQEMTRLFGEGKYYGADPFHEGAPPVKGSAYMNATGVAIYKLIESVVPNAIWAKQSWGLKTDLLEDVPAEKFVLLDLRGNYQTDKPWEVVTGVLHSFGGRTSLHGSIEKLEGKHERVIKGEAGSAGMGFFNEGSQHNPVYYNYYFDMMWKTEPVPVSKWLEKSITARYGQENAATLDAWKIFIDTIYSSTSVGLERDSLAAARPALDVRKTTPQCMIQVLYDPYLFAQGWKKLLEPVDTFKGVDAYQIDVADMCRQVLSNLMIELHIQVREAYDARDIDAFNKASAQFLQCIKDMDAVSDTMPDHRLEDWITDARSWGTNQAESDKFEENARMLLTRWGPLEMERAWDYAWREWQGLLGTYYHGRWEKLHNYLAETLKTDEVYYDTNIEISQGRQALRATSFLADLTEWEVNWITRTNTEDYKYDGRFDNGAEASAAMLAKYWPVIEKVYTDPSYRSKTEKYRKVFGQKFDNDPKNRKNRKK